MKTCQIEHRYTSTILLLIYFNNICDYSIKLECDIFNLKYFYVENNENVDVNSVVSCTFVDISVYFKIKYRLKSQK